MSSPSLSIVIPTHKRPEVLKQTLEHIDRQTIKDQLEVIVVSDGEELKMENGKWKMDVKIVNIPPCHQGVARNRGVELARGKYVMFIGDDILLAPDAAEKHLHQFSIFHFPFSTLGFTTWDPACGITPVMLWLEQSGWQFGYPMIARYAHDFVPAKIQHLFTYTSHISVPTDVAKKFPFREDATMYGWEDIEWGLRLKNAGVKLFYEPDAKALHHHHMTLEDSLKRMATLGKSAVVMEKRVPELKIVPRGWKRLKYQLASMLPTMRGKHARVFLEGMWREKI